MVICKLRGDRVVRKLGFWKKPEHILQSVEFRIVRRFAFSEVSSWTVKVGVPLWRN